MVYYHIRLSENESNLCMIILPWVNTGTKCLTMGVQTHQTFSNRKLMTYFMGWNSYVRIYIQSLGTN